MRFVTLVALVAVPLVVNPRAVASGADAWPPARPDSVAQVIVSGADAGYVKPKACWAMNGGALYRPAFESWLREHDAAVPRLWLSTGDVLTIHTSDGAVVPPAKTFDVLGAVPYDAVGIGLMDLEARGVDALLQLAAEHHVFLVSTNLIEFETGRPLVERSRVLDVGGQRVGVLAVTGHRPGRLWPRADGMTIVTVDPLEAARAEIERLADSVDAVLVLSTMLQPEVRDFANAIEGVDVIFAAAGTYRLPHEVVFGTRVFWVGGWGEILARAPILASGEVDTVQAIPVDGEFPIEPASGRRRDRVARMDE